MDHGTTLHCGPSQQSSSDSPATAKLSDLAYDRLEEMVVTCELEPGAIVAIHELQQRTGYGRTPVHQAVNRLAADTLIIVRPRYGLQIAAVDLDRERALLALRREMERFVARWAAERADDVHRARAADIAHHLRTARADLTVDAFNRLDREIDRTLLAATGEAFLESTLRPLHTLFRRIGWIYHRWARPSEGLGETVGAHLAILDAVAVGDAAAAEVAASRLVDFSESMFPILAEAIDPARLRAARAADAPSTRRAVAENVTSMPKEGGVARA